MRGSNKKAPLGAIGIGVAVALGAIGVGGLSKADGPRADAGRPVSQRAARPSKSTLGGAAAPATKAATTSQPGELVLEAAWGGAPGELGRRGGQESSPEGPMSFTIDANGRAVVLDQVNGRLQVFENGTVTRVVSLPTDTFQDVEARDGGFVALDRHGDQAVAFIDEAGKVTHEVALRDAGITEGGDVTALAQHDDGTWVEVQHQRWVRVADRDGALDPDHMVASGRRAASGATYRLARGGGAKASLVRLEDGLEPSVRWLTFDAPIWSLNALEIDAKGRVFVGAELADDSLGEESVSREEQVIVIDAAGVEVGRLSLPPSTGPEETLRSLRVGPDGALYQLVLTELGASMRRYWL